MKTILAIIIIFAFDTSLVRAADSMRVDVGSIEKNEGGMFNFIGSPIHSVTINVSYPSIEKELAKPRTTGRFNCNGGVFPKSLDTQGRVFINRTRGDDGAPYLQSIFQNLFQLSESKSSGACVTLCALDGMGGVGKTTLAVEYAWAYGSHYDTIFWINASSEDTLRRAYASLLQESLGERPSESDLQKSKEELAVNVVNKLSTLESNWLLICDNADESKDIEELLSLPRGHVLCTSRHSGWRNTINVGVLKEEEAIELLRRVSQVELGEEDRIYAKQLVNERLGGLALAITQAGSYVRQSHVRKRPISFKDYIDLFDNVARCPELLGYKIPDDVASNSRGEDPSKKAVMTTWKLTMDKLSDTAKQLMTYFAYLAPDMIPINLFYGEGDQDKWKVGEAIDDLVSYSMINRQNEYVSVHQLVQLVERVEQEKLGLSVESSPLTILKSFLGFYFSFTNKSQEEIRRLNATVPHVLTFIENIQKQRKSSIQITIFPDVETQKICLSTVAFLTTGLLNPKKGAEIYEKLEKESVLITRIYLMTYYPTLLQQLACHEPNSRAECLNKLGELVTQTESLNVENMLHEIDESLFNVVRYMRVKMTVYTYNFVRALANIENVANSISRTQDYEERCDMIFTEFEDTYKGKTSKDRDISYVKEVKAAYAYNLALLHILNGSIEETRTIYNKSLECFLVRAEQRKDKKLRLDEMQLFRIRTIIDFNESKKKEKTLEYLREEYRIYNETYGESHPYTEFLKETLDTFSIMESREDLMVSLFPYKLAPEQKELFRNRLCYALILPH